jgi:hypothetical protein
MRNKLLKNTSVRLGSLLTVSTLVFAALANAPAVFATTYLSNSSVIFTNMVAGQASSLIVTFHTSASNTGTNGSLVFSGWTNTPSTGELNAAQTVATSYNSTNCTAIVGGTISNLPGSPTATSTPSSGTITVTDASALSASTTYCYVLTNAITLNPSSAGQGTVALTAGSDGATNVTFQLLSGDTVTVGATVPQSFNLVLSGSSDNFTSNLSTGSVGTTTGVTATVTTNAKNGYALWGSDSNQGLVSPSQGSYKVSTTAGSNTTLTAGTQGYVTAVPTTTGAGGITQGTGTGTTAAVSPFASSGSGNGSALTSAPLELATDTGGTANGSIVTIKEYAAISGNTPGASDYADTITIVGAGSF